MLARAFASRARCSTLPVPPSKSSAMRRCALHLEGLFRFDSVSAVSRCSSITALTSPALRTAFRILGSST